MHAKKRPRYTYGPQLERKGPQLFQMVDRLYSSRFIPDYSRALTRAGAWIFDNSALLGRLNDGELLQSDSRVYLGFACPSDFSTTQVTTLLRTYHDMCMTKYLHELLDSFDMVTEAKKLNHTPMAGTHACLDIDFTRIRGLDPGGPEPFVFPETAAAVRKTINKVLRSAFHDFIDRYRHKLELPDDLTADELEPLPQFLRWLSKNNSELRLFVTVRHTDQIIGRFLHAAMWERQLGSILSNRMHILRQLVLEPLWRELASPTGIVRKLMAVGPYMLDSLVQPSATNPDLTGLPMFLDLSSQPSLLGFTSSQIWKVFELDEEDMTPALMNKILRHCNLVDLGGRGKADTRRFSPESVLSVFQALLPHLDLLRSSAQLPKEIQGSLYTAYLSNDRKEAAARALYPLLRMNSSFRKTIADLLADKQSLNVAYGPIFSLDDLVMPGEEQMAARAFMMGLMAPTKGGGEANSKSYVLAGGCARALLRHAFDQCRHPEPTLKVDAVSTASLTRSLTEQEIANLVLEHYRDTPASELPNDEAGFQAHFVAILRAVLLKHYGKSGFPSDVQIEVWLRKDKNSKDSGHRRSDVIFRVRCRGHDWLYIFELKYFNPTDTMDATHAYLKELNEKRPNGQYVLRSQSCPITEKLGVFCHEVGSMRDVPAHWYVAAGLPRVQLGFTFVPHHIRAYYKEASSRPKAEAEGEAAHGQSAQREKTSSDERTIKVKEAIAQTVRAGEQATLYRDAASFGVMDQYGVGKGVSDARFTRLGVGNTIIVPFTVVNIAGGLMYVEKHEVKEVNHRIAVVDAYPWTPDPSKKDTDDIYNTKKSLP